MVCANPRCRRESDYLREGSVYCIDEIQQNTEMTRRRLIWLCGACAPNFVVETWRRPGEQLRSSITGPKSSHAHPEGQPEPHHQNPRREHTLPPRRPVASDRQSHLPVYVTARSK